MTCSCNLATWRTRGAKRQGRWTGYFVSRGISPSRSECEDQAKGENSSAIGSAATSPLTRRWGQRPQLFLTSLKEKRTNAVKHPPAIFVGGHQLPSLYRPDIIPNRRRYFQQEERKGAHCRPLLACGQFTPLGYLGSENDEGREERTPALGGRRVHSCGLVKQDGTGALIAFARSRSACSSSA